MKPTTPIVFLLFLLPILCLAQPNYKEKAHEAWNRAQASEVNGSNSHDFTASEYEKAGKNYYLESKLYTTKGNRKKYLEPAKEAFTKAVFFYDKAGYLTKAKIAQLELDKVSKELESVTYTSVLDKKKDENTGPQYPPAGTSLAARMEFSARYAIFSFQPPASLGKLIPRRSKTTMGITTVEVSPDPIPIGITETAFSLMQGMPSANSLPSGEEICDGEDAFNFSGKEILNMMKKEGVVLEKEKRDEMKATNLGIKKEVIDLGPVKGCLSTLGGTSITEDYVLVMIQFSYKGNLYVFGMKGPTAWAKILERSAKTFRIKEVKIPDGGIDCIKGEETLLKDRAIVNFIQLPLTGGKTQVRFVISPVLPRRQVPLAGWKNLLAAINNGLDFYQKAHLTVKIKSPDKVERIKDLWAQESKLARSHWTVQYAREYAMEAVLELGEIGGIGYSKAIQGYLSVMESCVEAINGLEGTISNAYSNVTWEVPYITIKAECIPRMKCEGGKFVPDQDFLLSQEARRDTGMERSVKKYLTPRQVDRERQRMEAFIDRLSNNEQRLNQDREDGLCGKAMARIRDYEFWESSVECQRLDRQIYEADFEKELMEKEKEELEEQLQSYLTEKKGKIPVLESNIKEWAARKKVVDVELDRVDKRIKLFEANKKGMDPVEYERRQVLNQREYQKWFDESDFLEIQISKARSEINYYKSVKFEQVTQNRIENLRDEISNKRNAIKRFRSRKTQLRCK